MKQKTQFEKHPSPIDFLAYPDIPDRNKIIVSINMDLLKLKSWINNPNDIEFQTLKKCINQEMVTTGDWEKLTGQKRDCME
ncbi:MAG: hypothetical protein O2802_03285 [Proteobacteria bacterium]|nr:hypothetical protein [Pseudomonadota bacterium]|tara:strand:+ start:259 stop:501 length:243 start_codon:yes stop_codon:yes gene_type:complete